MRRFAIWMVGMVLILISGPACQKGGLLHPEEQMIFLPSIGYAATDGGHCILRVQGWLYEPYWTADELKAFEDLFDIDEMVENEQQRALLRERLVPFLVDNKSGRAIEISIGDETVTLKETNDFGQITDEIKLTVDQMKPLQAEGGKVQCIKYSLAGADTPAGLVCGMVHFTEGPGFGIISDIDDTIRVTEVQNTKRMLKNTFLEAYRPVLGMRDLYARWVEEHGCSIHYVTASPRQLSPTMLEFLDEQKFPPGSVDFHTASYDGSTIKFMLTLLEAPEGYKAERITRILQALPERRFILVGDSGQDDPEIYAELARAYPLRIAGIVIRDVTCEGPDAPRYQVTFEDLPAPLWQIFRDPSQIKEESLFAGAH